MSGCFLLAEHKNTSIEITLYPYISKINELNANTIGYIGLARPQMNCAQ